VAISRTTWTAGVGNLLLTAYVISGPRDYVIATVSKSDMISHVSHAAPPTAGFQIPPETKKENPLSAFPPTPLAGFSFLRIDHLISSSSTSKTSVLFGGMSGLGLFAP
jgi:hypothetical protein